jgi:hypothetical protein
MTLKRQYRGYILPLRALDKEVAYLNFARTLTALELLELLPAVI